MQWIERTFLSQFRYFCAWSKATLKITREQDVLGNTWEDI